MTYEELDNQFDIYFNNITSNQAPGLNTYEKSVFLTKAQNEIVKNYFTANSQGNPTQQGFDDSAKRQADFSCLMKTKECYPDSGSSEQFEYNCIAVTSSGNYIYLDNISFLDSEGNPYTERIPTGEIPVENNQIIIPQSGEVTGKSIQVVGLPENCNKLIITRENKATVENRIDKRSLIYHYPDDVFIVINESIRCTNNKDLQVAALRYDEYFRLMSKPYKRPLKFQAWRLINKGIADDNTTTKNVEIIIGPNDKIATYTVRYIRFPKPIIVGPLDGLTINGHCFTGDGTPNAIETEGCELDPIIHEDILQRAVELAKISWTSTGQDNAQLVLEAGKRSE